MKNQTRLTIPMNKELRTRLKERASNLGFDSAQALLRYVSKAIIDERSITFGAGDDWGEPSPRAARRLNRWAKEAIALSRAGKLKSYTSAKEFMKDLNRDIGKTD
ncbi:hypothetical protein HY375_04010 [Candidatus Berkelbacteria bacterium]|nr:hypothetical protein [Candidatus Berkelbacteria bacterium]